ncbi:MAG: transposase [Nitrospirae bacterium]|nr:transposase [Nitrospirota bacterium]MBF0533935.1 transposase [Nitrospirota bacterium]MBF0618027.1 transposase [Nitrospirota bacterium]
MVAQSSIETCPGRSTAVEIEIRAAHNRTRQTYGSERLQRDLSEHGLNIGICCIKRIRKKPGIRSKQKRRFKATRPTQGIRFLWQITT